MVDHLVIRHDDMCPVADGKALGRNSISFILQGIDFFDEYLGVYDNSGADNAQLLFMKDARGNQMEYNLLISHYQGMTGVVAALEPDDKLGLFRQEVYYLSLAFISPLGAYYHHVCHRKAPLLSPFR